MPLFWFANILLSQMRKVENPLDESMSEKKESTSGRKDGNITISCKICLALSIPPE